MGKPKVHIYCRDVMTNVPQFSDSPVMRDRFDVTRGPHLSKHVDLYLFETDHLVADKTKYPYALLVSGFWPKENTRPGKRKRVGKVLRGARSVICASKFLAAQVKAHFKTHSAVALPAGLWGTDHVGFKVNPARFRPKKHYHQHRRGPFVVMSISLASEIKWRGVDVFLGASHGVLEDHNANVINRAMVRGRGDLADRWLSEYGLITQPWRRAEGLKFTRGLGDVTWPKMLRRADLFVHPSTWDAWGCVVADAMFTAVPSIVFNDTGSAEISDVAIKVNPGNPDEIADAVDRVLSMSVRDREEYGNALRTEAMCKNETHRGDIADAIEAVLENL